MNKHEHEDALRIQNKFLVVGYKNRTGTPVISLLADLNQNGCEIVRATVTPEIK